MACNRIINTTGSPSILFDYIYENIAKKDEQLAEDLWTFFKTESFKDEFGDWEADYDLPIKERTINQSLVDINGEPKLVYDKAKASHYYTNKHGIKVYYPNNLNKLNQFYSYDAIRTIVERVSLQFLSERFRDNFDDIDLGSMKGTLSESIKQQLTDKSEELMQSDDMNKFTDGALMADSIEYLDEWVRLANNFYMEHKLVYKEETDADYMDLDSENTRENQTFGTSSFERSSKDNISSNIKLKLSLLRLKLSGNEKIDIDRIDNIFYEPKLIPFDSVYSTLMNKLTSITALENEDLFQLMLDEINNLSKIMPEYESLYDNIKDIEPYQKAEFVQAFNLSKNNFIGFIFDIDETTNKSTGETTYSVNVKIQNLSNAGGKRQSVKSLWHTNFLDNFTNNGRINNKSKLDFINTNKVIKQELKELDSLILTSEKNEDLLEIAKTKYKEVLYNLGIETTDKAFDLYLNNLSLNEISLEDKFQKLYKLKQAIVYFDRRINLDKLTGNPFDDQTEFIKLADAEAFFIQEGSDSSIFTAGKNKWLFSYPSYLSNKLASWKKNPELLIQHYESTPFNNKSHYMNVLTAEDKLNPEDRIKASKERLEQFEVSIFNSLQRQGKGIAVDTKGTSKNDAFASNFNSILGFKVKGRETYIQTPTPADKSTQYLFNLAMEMMVDTETNPRGEVNEATKKIIYNYVVGEYNRIKYAEKEIELAGDDLSKLRVHYHLKQNKDTGEWEAKGGNALQFQMFPSLNHENFNAEEAGFQLYNEDGTIIDYEFSDLSNIDSLESIEHKNVETKLIEYISEKLTEQIKRTREHLVNIKMLEREDGNFINRAFDKEIWNAYNNDPNTAIRISGDIFINNLISQVEYGKLFSGDPAYYKNMIDYKKRIPATYTDGQQLYLLPGEENFTASIISSVYAPVPNYENMVKILGKEGAKPYKNVNVADAQAWITPKRWRFLKQKLGKWNKIDDIVYDKITGKNTESLTPEEYKRVAQPLKGVYFEINDGVPVFLKYSQAVLTPMIIKNSPELKRFSDMMEKQKVDELITLDGIKVGANLPITTHNQDGTLADDFTLNTLSLKNSGWKLQQDLPVKGFKQTAVGSQIQKNIYLGLARNLDKTFDVDGVDMNGLELIQHIDNIVGQISSQGLNELFNEIGIDSDYRITNRDKLFQTLVNELKSRKAAQNVIDALENDIPIYAIPGYQDKIQNIFASIVRDRIVKIKTNGGAFIQMSNYGISKTEGDGIIYTPWAEDKTHEPAIIKDPVYDENGKLLEKGIVRPGGILISGEFIAKFIPDYREYKPEQLFGTKENDYKDGMIDRKILSSVIGYRIPNQGLASNDALEIVGILPEENGDTVVAYTGITTKTGSDFDIDKMYIMMPSIKPIFKYQEKIFKYLRKNHSKLSLEDSIESLQALIDQLEETDLSIDIRQLAVEMMSYSEQMELENTLLQDLTQAILSSNSEKAKEIKKNIPEIEIVEGLKYDDKSRKGSLQNSLIQAYKAVLTHPDNIENIMTPIDFDFFKDDILSLFKKEENPDLKDFNIIDEINLRYEFLTGQAGVGMTANQLVDHARGQMAYLGVPYLDIGVDTRGFSKLDNEYSEELSDRDLKYYLKVINKGRKEGEKVTLESLKKIKIADSLSAVMNAFVDIANDSYITKGNWTTQTSNVGMMLLRAGIHPFKVNAILANPIITEYIDFLQNSESKIVSDTGNMEQKFIEDRIINELRTTPVITIGNKTRGHRDIYNAIKYNIEDTEVNNKIIYNKLNRLFGTKLDATQFTDIVNNVREINSKYTKADFKLNLNDKSLEYLRNQATSENPDINFSLGLFKQFTKWNRLSKDLNDNIKASKHDVDAYGKNITSMIIYNNLLNKLQSPDSQFKGYSTKLEFKGEPTILGHYKKYSIDEIFKVMKSNPEIFLTASQSVVNTFNTIAYGINGQPLLNQELGDKLEKSLYSYVISGFKPFQLSIEQRTDLLNQMPKLLKDYRKENPNNILINELEEFIGDYNKPFIGMGNRQKSTSFQNKLTIAWKTLLEENPDLGNKLIQYSFITSGFQMSSKQFHSYIPFEWFMENNFPEYLKETYKKFENNDIETSFIENFFRHNTGDGEVVPLVFNNQKSDIKGEVKTNIGFIKANDATEYKPQSHNPLYLKEEHYILEADRTDTHLYKLIGLTLDDRGIYVRTIPKGYKDKRGNNVYELDFENEGAGSRFADINTTGVPVVDSNGKTIDGRGYFYDLIEKPIPNYDVFPEELSELNEFNENPELANSVYEALGVDQKRIIKEYPKQIEWETLTGKASTEKLQEITNLNFDGNNVVEFNPNESYSKTVSKLYGENAGRYVKDTSSEISHNEGKWLKENPEFAKQFITDFLESELGDGETMQSFAQKLLDKNVKLIDTAQTVLFGEQPISQITPEQKQQAQTSKEVVQDLSGNTYSANESDITTYETEFGSIRYITNENGDMVMLSDKNVEVTSLDNLFEERKDNC